ncbi:flavin reductase family protein [Bradyrhizobium sp. LA7.1]|uniref:flavin reductase family protein n=1 Tax=Bradyrhizobium sp. LA7.1 TaxID=3156324 RepID=UPI003393FB18
MIEGLVMNSIANGDRFRQIMGRFATGVAVVTAKDSNKNYGMTVNSLTSVSLDPALLLVCLAHGKSTLRAILESKRFAVHLLGSQQEALCKRFVKHERDKFDGLELVHHNTGLPILKDCLAYVVCDVDSVHAAGDHDIVVGRARDYDHSDSEPLLYLRGQFGRFAALCM